MDKREKRVFLYIAFAIGLYAVVTHLDKVIKMFGYVGNLFTPIVAGLIIALFSMCRCQALKNCLRA